MPTDSCIPRRIATAVVATLSLAALAACANDPGSTSGGSAAPSSTGLPVEKADAALHAKLPDSVRQSGVLTSVNTGSFPPYTVTGSTTEQATGASSDLLKAVGQVLGVTTKEVTVDGLPGEMAGIGAGRYDLALGPVGDFKSRQTSADFVDWVQEFVVFAVPKGNPKNINGLDNTCGLRIAVQAGGSAEAVIKKQADTCTAGGKPAVEVQSYKDQPTSVLSVQSGRADAFFSSEAPLTYFVKQSNGALQLAGTGQSNGFDQLFQGAMVGKNSALRDVLLAALTKLFDDGTYGKIMDKYGLQRNKIDKPGVDLAKS